MRLFEWFFALLGIADDVRFGRQYGFGGFLWGLACLFCIFFTDAFFDANIDVLGWIGIGGTVACFVGMIRCTIHEVYKKRETKGDKTVNQKKTLQGCTFSILGDSYSTFQGFIPQGYACYYPKPQSVQDVLQVEHTWWYQLMQRRQLKLLQNNSYSGSTVCTHVRDGQPVTASFAARVHTLAEHTGENGRGPDYIFLFGCTNDSWQNRTVGNVQYENWKEEDLRCVLPAYCYVLDVLCREIPQTTVVCIANTDLKPQILEGMGVAAEHYGALMVELKNIDKNNGHPTALGMQQIADQVEAALK